MTPQEVIKNLSGMKQMECFTCIHPQQVGWCENNCHKDDIYDAAIYALEKQIWISTKDKMPKDMEVVNITWINRNPSPYYAEMKDVPRVATGLVMNGRWYWFSCYSENIAEFNHLADVDRMDKDIEVVAWTPLPEPYKEGDTE